MHSIEKVLYCIDCAIAVCPMCFYEDEIHEKHDKKSIYALYDEKKERLQNMMSDLAQNKIRFKKRDKKMAEKIAQIKSKEAVEINKV